MHPSIVLAGMLALLSPLAFAGPIETGISVIIKRQPMLPMDHPNVFKRDDGTFEIRDGLEARTCIEVCGFLPECPTCECPGLSNKQHYGFTCVEIGA